MAKVCVLLSAYNGEQFIEEQLASLTAQKGVEVDILVRDDGSTDTTRTILERWQQKGALRWYGGENLGWAMSFIHLLCHAPEADYYAFCDHDDIWLPEKLEEPAVLHYNIRTALVKCIPLGCTVVMSRALQQSISQHPPKSVCAHDFWGYQVALAVGNVCYDPRSFILYRQHAHNQIGQTRSWCEIWRSRLKRLRGLRHQHDREELATQLLECHGAEMDEETRAAVRKVSDYRRSLKNRLSLFADRRYTMGRRSNDVWLRLRILFGKL